MAALPDADRVSIHREFAGEVSAARGTVGTLTRAQLKAAVDAVDQWVEDNSTTFNAAIPQPARGVLTTKQKAELLMRVVRRRFEVT